MACTLFSRLFHKTHRQPVTSNQPPSNSTFAKFGSSIKKVKMAALAKMDPEPVVSFVVYSVPVWLNRNFIEDFLKTVPEIVQVRYKKSTFNKQQLDLILDFAAGTDVFKILKRTENGRLSNSITITIDHQLFSLYQLPTGYDLKNVKIASTSKPSPGAINDITNQKVLKLDNLDVNTPECQICRNDLDGAFSTPCWSCQSAQCYECIKRQFSEALKNFERFPARCCQMAFHPDVGKSILTEDDHAKYKKRFEEWLTTRPIYCPVSTCSAFIPPRLVRVFKDGTFKCHACNISMCVACNQRAHVGRSCTKTDEDVEALDTIKKFGYKQCPRCGIAVGKMFGCSHIQCNCGAHWCWDCSRRVELCNMDPCDQGGGEQYYNEQQESDIDSVISGDEVDPDSMPIDMPFTTLPGDVLPSSEASDTDMHAHVTDHEATYPSSSPLEPYVIGNETLSSEDVQHDALVAETLMNMRNQDEPARPLSTAQMNATEASTHTTSASVTNSGVTTTEAVAAPESLDHEFVNLDDPRATEWAQESLFFGDEPAEDDSLDMWGCLHCFTPVNSNQVPRHWMTASIPDWWEKDVSQQRVECMICLRSARVVSTEENADEVDTKKTRDWRFARRCLKCGIFVCRKCKNQLSKPK